MMSGATGERVYDAVKRQILERVFRPGDRLDPTALGDALHSSVTPVRGALHRLVGEQLVEARPAEGFHLLSVDAPGLQDLYGWNAELIGLALRRWVPRPVPPNGPADVAADPHMLAASTAALFSRVAQRSPNVEHRRAVASVNDRLHAVRLVEPRVFTDVAAELAALSRALTAGPMAQARRLLTVYHRRRQRAAADLVRILYRNGER